jgi:hypothetical protein
MSPALETIQSFVAPVVMISANGLLCLAFYNRLSAIANRSRTINRERFELLGHLQALDPHLADSPATAHQKKRIEILDELGHRLFQRARWLRGTLLCLLVSVLAMLACSLALGLSSLGAVFGWAALAAFVAGALAMMAGIVMAIQELLASLEPLWFEHHRTEDQPHRPL